MSEDGRLTEVLVGVCYGVARVVDTRSGLRCIAERVRRAGSWELAYDVCSYDGDGVRTPHLCRFHVDLEVVDCEAC